MLDRLNRVFTRILLLAGLALGSLAVVGYVVIEQSRDNLFEQRAIGGTTRQTESMAQSLERLLHAAGDTNASSQTVVSSASGLSDQAASLKSKVAEFVTRMKAA
jgi:hypothetical protein